MCATLHADTIVDYAKLVNIYANLWKLACRFHRGFWICSSICIKFAESPMVSACKFAHNCAHLEEYTMQSACKFSQICTTFHKIYKIHNGICMQICKKMHRFTPILQNPQWYLHANLLCFLFVCLCVCVCVCVCLCICLSDCLCACLFVCLFVWLFICLFVCLFVCVFVLQQTNRPTTHEPFTWTLWPRPGGMRAAIK